MSTCKKRGLGLAVRSGVVAGKQRWRCKECGYNFREGDVVMVKRVMTLAGGRFQLSSDNPINRRRGCWTAN
jgi:hypothetical protein